MNVYELKNKMELDALCKEARTLTYAGDYKQCEKLIANAFGQFPHNPEPHNLIGLLLEKTGDHLTAMKHFRAAWALDPTYGPAIQNLDIYGTSFSCGKCAFDESDCPQEKTAECSVEHDKHGIGHIIRRV